jgi:AraC family transcriptional regulator, transcriptional activator of pobA
MIAPSPTTPRSRRQPYERIEFHRTKYGPELLVDAAWLRDMPTFLRHDAHYLPFYEILLVTRGRGWFWLDAERHRVEPGRVLFTSPGQVRQWQVRNLDGLCLFFPAAFLGEFFHDPLFLHRLPYFHVSAADGALTLSPGARAKLRRQLLSMQRELREVRPDTEHLLRARLYEVLVTLARDFSAIRGVEADREPHRVALAFRALVEREGRQQHQVAHYARALAVSPGHLNAIARRHLGQSAKEVIQERLAVEARRLLLYTDESASRVGLALGFRDPSYFTRFFRRVVGRAPSVFRAQATRRRDEWK